MRQPGVGQELSQLLADVERFSPSQWERVRALVAGLPPDDGDFWTRAQVRLVLDDRRGDLARLEWQRLQRPDDARTHVKDGVVYADLPGVSVPLREEETPLWASVREAGLLFAGIRLVDLAEHPPTVEVMVDGVRIEARPAPAPLANVVARLRHQDQGPGAVEVTLPPGSDRIEVRVRAGGVTRSGLVAVRAAPPLRTSPLRDDERGPYAQQRLVESYQRSRAPLDPDLVYFQAFAGAAPTDSPAAICAELRRRRPELRTVWGVKDPAFPVHEGSEVVLLHSREWYDVMARAGHLVVGTDLPMWFQRRDGQRVLQTYHGHPSKTMGHALWRAKNFTPSHVSALLARTRDAWTAVLSPAPDMDHYYREEYSYDGQIISVGLPRDDALVASTADDRRAAVRAGLGISSDQLVVLHAPTWRDAQGEQLRAVRTRGLLDPDALAADLGPSYVVLDRGHRFQRKRPARRAALDVTGHPEVNDLILAADVAVLDYSSLRFDFALTGKPMVFYVPDLDAYAGPGRGFLFPFEDSAPGPLVSSSEEVVAALSDLDTLRAAHTDEIAAFNRRFNYLHDGHAAERVVDAFFPPEVVEQ